MQEKKDIKGMGKILQLLSPFSLLKNIPYIILVFVLTVVYISNSNKAISIVREHSRKLNELKEERWRYRDLQSRLMYQTSERMIMEKSKEVGLQPMDKPAFEIVK